MNLEEIGGDMNILINVMRLMVVVLLVGSYTKATSIGTLDKEISMSFQGSSHSSALEISSK